MIKKRLDMSAFLLAIIAIILISGVIVVLYAMRRDSVETDIKEDRVLNSLFVFEHEGKPIGSFAVFYYSKNNRVALVEIPGEVGLILDQVNRVDRIDSVYDKHKITPYLNEIERLLGIRMAYTVVFDMPNLVKFIDLIDGISIFIPDSVRIYNGENSILFPSGITNLDGDKANIYLTFEDSEDYTSEKKDQRVKRFFLGVIKKVGMKRAYLQTPGVNKMFLSFIRSNANDKAIAHLVSELSKIDTDRLSIITIAGNLREVSGNTLLIPSYDGSLIKDIVSQSLSSLTRQGGSSGGEQVWTVEILNGTNVAGLAGRTAELIRGFGYDVIMIGNADRNDYAKSEIINRTQETEEAIKFADIIKCRNIKNEALNESYISGAIVDYELKADFTLIIGRDFNGRYTNG